jgi:peptidoglycan/LPS O-acetylase OafA/YrhL
VNTAQDSTTRINALTGLRILAAVAVFLSHALAPAFAPVRLNAFMAAGYNGVTVFFMLSGFVLAWNYSDRLRRPSGRALWSFFIARIARIYPLYLFALAWGALPVLLSGQIPTSFWLHVLAVQPWSSDVTVAFGYNAPGWSIGVEFFLYVCFPLLVVALRALRNRPRALVAVAIFAVGASFALAWWFQITGRAALGPVDPGSAHRWLYRTPVTRLADFTVGIVAAMLIRHGRPHHPWIGTVAQAVGGLSIVALMSEPRLYASVWSWDAAYQLPTFLLLWGLAANGGSVLARGLASRPLVIAGEASFAFYLLHKPLLYVLRPVGYDDSWFDWTLTTGLVFSIILFVAIGAHLALELPAQRWIRATFDRTKSIVPDRATLPGEPELRVAVEAVLPRT